MARFAKGKGRSSPHVVFVIRPKCFYSVSYDDPFKKEACVQKSAYYTIVSTILVHTIPYCTAPLVHLS